MKTSRKTGKPAAKKASGPAQSRGRRMEPVKAKETKNLRFDEDDEEQEPEILEEDNFKGFDDFYGEDEDDED
jgi:hypothetical protein